MLTVIAVGPTVEPSIFHGGQIVRHEVGSEFVTLIDNGPKRAARRLESQPVGIAQPHGKQAPATGSAINLPDRGTVLFGLHAVLGDVAIGSYANVQQRAVLTGHQTFGPMVTNRPAG